MSPHRSSTRPVEVKDERQQKQEMMKCPRCDSPNTKFCYYNNYSLAQPRHFCKACRRYWTRGGALRNVPIGGGCRKNKKVKSSSMESGLKLLHGLSPAMEFQRLGGVSYPLLNLALASKNCYDHISSSSSSSSSCSDALMGFHHLPAENINSSNGTSIESLSYLNQDLHWKLQQQRLATQFPGEITRDVASMALENQTQKLQRPVGDSSMGLFFSNSNHVQTMNIAGTGYKNALTGSSWSGIQSWADLDQFQGSH